VGYCKPMPSFFSCVQYHSTDGGTLRRPTCGSAWCSFVQHGPIVPTPICLPTSRGTSSKNRNENKTHKNTPKSTKVPLAHHLFLPRRSCAHQHHQPRELPSLPRFRYSFFRSNARQENPICVDSNLPNRMVSVVSQPRSLARMARREERSRLVSPFFFSFSLLPLFLSCLLLCLPLAASSSVSPECVSIHLHSRRHNI